MVLSLTMMPDEPAGTAALSALPGPGWQSGGQQPHPSSQTPGLGDDAPCLQGRGSGKPSTPHCAWQRVHCQPSSLQRACEGPEQTMLRSWKTFISELIRAVGHRIQKPSPAASLLCVTSPLTAGKTKCLDSCSEDLKVTPELLFLVNPPVLDSLTWSRFCLVFTPRS